MKDPLLALLPEACAHWEKTEPVLARVAREHAPTARSLPEGTAFESLATSIIHQQVSLAAGYAIHARVTEAAGGTLAPENVIKLGPDGLRAAGLSTRKAAYVLDLATRVTTGALDLDALAAEPDEEVVSALTAVKGIGAWTAKMFCLFHLSRPDVLAHEDEGLRIAVADLYDVPRAEAAAKMRELGPAWSPYASVAAITLWNWRRLRMTGEA